MRRLASGIPGSVKFRLLNTLEHFDRSAQLFESDREMASFRAITGEEEAATALIKAIQLRRYLHSKEINARDHQHKAAVISCVMAIAAQVAQMLKEFQLTCDFAKRRFDVKLPLSNFNVDGGENLAIQFVEPLDIAHRREGSNDREAFDDALENLAKRSNFNDIKRMVASQANDRNTLLYASDSSLPLSSATLDGLQNRKKRALILLVISVMILQSHKHQAFVCQAILAFLGVISRLPRDDVSG